MSRVTVTRVIPAPIEAVWSVFADITDRPTWLSEVESVEVLTPDEPRRGLRWRETRVDAAGTRVTEELMVTDIEPDRSMTLTLAGEGEASHLVYEFVPIEIGELRGGTSVTATVESRPHGLTNLLVTFLLGEIAARTAEGHLREELDELAIAAVARTERHTAA